MKKKTILLIMLMLLFANVFFSLTYANSNEESINKFKVYSNNEVQSYIKYKNVPQEVYEYYYMDVNNNTNHAYCLTFGKVGAEKLEDGYMVDCKDYIKDNEILAVLMCGYPYKGLTELGVTNISQAKYATQFALWIKKNNWDIDMMTPDKTENKCVLDAVKQILYESNNKILKENTLKVKCDKNVANSDEIDSNYYSNTYKLEYDSNVVDEIKLNIKGLSNIKIVDENNKQIDNIKGKNKIKVMIPKSQVLKDEKITLDFKTTLKQDSALLGSPNQNNLQDMALSLLPTKIENISLDLEIKYIPRILTINKLDKENSNIKIKGAKFAVYNKDKILGEYTTNSDGKIILDIQKDLKVYDCKTLIIKEIYVPEPYIVDGNNTQEVNIYNLNNISVTFKNSKLVVPEKVYEVELPKTGY